MLFGLFVTFKTFVKNLPLQEFKTVTIGILVTVRILWTLVTVETIGILSSKILV